MMKSAQLNPAAEVVPDEMEITGNQEARVPRTLTAPELPSRKEVEEHCVTHAHYRNWCPVCVQAQGKEDPHRRDGGHENDGGALVTIGPCVSSPVTWSSLAGETSG